MRKKSAKDQIVFVSVEKIARALHISPRHVQRLTKVGMPRRRRGKYDLTACALWAARFYQDALRQKETADGSGKSFLEERKRLTKVKADLVELELAKARGKLIPIDFYRDLVCEQATTIRENFMRLPSRIAPQLEGEDRASIKAKLDQAVRGILVALSRGEYRRGAKYEENT